MEGKRLYEKTKLRLVRVKAEDFVKGMKNDLAEKRIMEIIETESPITLDLLSKRLINSFGFFREGANISSYVSALIDRMVEKGEFSIDSEEGIPVIHTPGDTGFYRTHEGLTSEESRYSYQTPPSEARACIDAIKKERGDGLERSELLNRFKKEMGWQRAGSQVEALFEKALNFCPKR